MDISLIHAGLAAGAALAVIPLIIHLVMRQTPKRVIFPALQLLRQRHKRSTKRLRIKNWLLLAARMALVALMALALARPALNARVPLGDREVPTALAMVIDTSLSMGFTDRGKTRLAEAKDLAGEVLRKLPESSQVYVIDSGLPGVPAPSSPSAARKRINDLALRPANRPLNAAIEQGYAALAESPRDLPRREVYVLTDLARSSWELGRPVGGRDAAEKTLQSEIPTYVIRLAPEEVRNVAIVAVEAGPVESPDPEQGGAFEVRGTIRNIGPAGSRVVEFLLDGKRRAQEEVELPADGQVEVRFRTPTNLEEGIHQGELRLSGTDPLPFDDRRFVTFQARPSYDILIVYDEEPRNETRNIDSWFVANALDPYGFGRPHRVEQLATNRIQNQFPKPLKDYACIFLNNVERLPEACWNQLAAYVREGGGLVVGLGNRSDPANYSGAIAGRIMPARIEEVKAPPGGTAFGQIADESHPIFDGLARELAADLSLIPVRRYAAVTPSEATQILLRYQDGAPALVERLIPGPQPGRVLLWTTPLSRRAEADDPAAWNEFPITGWSFLALLDRTVPYLAGASGMRLNFEAGEDVDLPIAPGERASSYVVQGPEGSDLAERINPPREAPSLVVVAPQALGNWIVTAAESGTPTGPPDLGFSVNPRPEESTFTPLNKEDLVVLFGDEESFALADSPENLQREIRNVRVGREIFPWLMALILVLVTVENYLANRFHRDSPAAGAAPPSRGRAVAAG
ncbi:hypothetical protein BH23PLA1_BH23PLA1_13040 [soil metagenome]